MPPALYKSLIRPAVKVGGTQLEVPHKTEQSVWPSSEGQAGGLGEVQWDCWPCLTVCTRSKLRHTLLS